ncbi:YbaB/EbfC family nucleoid-associated protein [Streptomyces sp. GC420]|uniref:YbaB/EbfC family nucleoid-associated protein n=1 Tax=Streptomyces sp. GC420 TaxID=2697568 RepID=UPI0014152A3D|nr:YbaB/EbfC family nucleoid-associated protein [Streptomyces sp. GC420]NBM15784.1 YbaB/EbfC family DNA-binding protein [Streptomyces sp. GC420]
MNTPDESLEPIERRIARARAELAAVQAAVARAESELRQASVTVRSRDRSVEVTVGPQGELTQLRFLDNKYRTMTATQLAASVLEAAGQGRAEMAHRVMETFEPLTRPSGNVPEFRGIDVDWDRLFGTALGGGHGPGGPRPARDRLRDEIHEDTHDESRTRGRGRP